MVTEVKNLYSYFKQIASRYFTSLNSLNWIVRLILSRNSKKLNQKLYPNSLYIVDITLILVNEPDISYFSGILFLFELIIGKFFMTYWNEVS